MCAAQEGHTDVVQVLLSRQDVDINMRDKVCNGNGIRHVTAGLIPRPRHTMVEISGLVPTVYPYT